MLGPLDQSKIVHSLIDTYAHLGWLLNCRMQLCKGYMQGGSNAEIAIADAWLKNPTRPDTDCDQAYEAVVNDAENKLFD